MTRRYNLSHSAGQPMPEDWIHLPDSVVAAADYDALAACQSQASGILRAIRGDIEAAYNGLDYLTNTRVAMAADPNSGRQLAIAAAEIKGRLLQHMKRIDAHLAREAKP